MRGRHAYLISIKRLLNVRIWTLGLLAARVLAIVLLSALIIAVINVHKVTDSTDDAPSSEQQASSIDDLQIKQFSKTDNVSDMRTLFTSYLNKGDYNNASRTINKIAAKTNLSDDYLIVLRICSLYDVSNKQDCINAATNELQPVIQDLSFIDSYMAGYNLEEAGNKELSVAFFQRAYDIYPATVDGDFLSKSHLKEHIDELKQL